MLNKMISHLVEFILKIYEVAYSLTQTIQSLFVVAHNVFLVPTIAFSSQLILFLKCLMLNEVPDLEEPFCSFPKVSRGKKNILELF